MSRLRSRKETNVEFHLIFISILNKMSVIGAQITSSGEIPLLRSVIKHHIPFAPNSDLSLEPSNVRRTQPELQPWTPVMSNMQDITGVSTTNFAGPSFKIPDQPIGRIALDPLVTGRLGANWLANDASKFPTKRIHGHLRYRIRSE